MNCSFRTVAACLILAILLLIFLMWRENKDLILHIGMSHCF